MKTNGSKGRWYLEVTSVWCMLIIFTSFLHDRALAGGAAVMKKQQGQQMMQQQRMQQEMMQQKMLQEKMQMEQLRQKQNDLLEEQQRTHALSAEQLGVQSEVTFEEIIHDLSRSSRAWPLMIDVEAKEAVVQYFLNDFQKKGIAVQKPAWYYVTLVDSAGEQSPDMLEQPLDRVLQVLAVLEYDFDNGQNKDQMAYQVLGSKEAVIHNRQRLGLP